jgi:outer membrane protein assembly factor BamB
MVYHSPNREQNNQGTIPMKTISIVITACAAAIACAAEPTAESQQYWPQWRGPLGIGVAPKSNPPTEWSESKNIRWKVAIPGRGHATPIVWGDRIYLQTAIDTEEAGADAKAESESGEGGGGRGRRGGPPPSTIYEFAVIALDRKTGETVWKTTVAESVPHERTHPDSTEASTSPLTDGEHIFAYFGSRGLHCLDMNGKIVWSKDFGDMQTRNSFGEGSSPALHGDTIVVVWDHEGEDFITALDKSTGAQRWRVARDQPTNWATPLIVETGGRAQVIASGTNYIRSYDLKTGEEIWSCNGMTQNVIPTPMINDELFYAISGFRGSALLAIRYADAKGDVTGSEMVAWEYGGKGTPYVPSGVLYEDGLYFLDNNRAILTCLDAFTGEKRYDKTRLEGIEGVYASLVAGGGRIYVAGRDGKTAVIKHGLGFELLAMNELDDGFDASPAIAGDELYLRGREHLYCIAE